MNDTSHTTHLPPSYHLLHKQPRLHGHVNALGKARDLSRLAPLISSSQTVTVRPRSPLDSSLSIDALRFESQKPHITQARSTPTTSALHPQSVLRLFQINA
jgi:hypothetical protein